MPQPCANTRISEGPARSRAEGVTMVFGPIAILRFSLIAARTSASHTKSTGAGGGVAAPGPAAAGSPVSQPNPPFGADAARRDKKRSTTSAATFETTDCVTTPAAGSQEQDGPAAAPDTAMPREAR